MELILIKRIAIVRGSSVIRIRIRFRLNAPFELTLSLLMLFDFGNLRNLMFKNKLFILFFTFLLIVVAIGCGSSDGGDYIIVNESQRSDEDNYITYEVKEGKLSPSKGATETGIQLIAKDNSLKDGVIITVTEKNLEDIKDNQDNC